MVRSLTVVLNVITLLLFRRLTFYWSFNLAFVLLPNLYKWSHSPMDGVNNQTLSNWVHNIRAISVWNTVNQSQTDLEMGKMALLKSFGNLTQRWLSRWIRQCLVSKYEAVGFEIVLWLFARNVVFIKEALALRPWRNTFGWHIVLFRGHLVISSYMYNMYKTSWNENAIVICEFGFFLILINNVASPYTQRQ